MAPVRVLLLAGEHERDVEAVAVVQLARVVDDDADAAGELQVVDEEGDLHAALSGGWPPLAGASCGRASSAASRARRTSSSAVRPRSWARSALRSAATTAARGLQARARGPKARTKPAGAPERASTSTATRQLGRRRRAGTSAAPRSATRCEGHVSAGSSPRSSADRALAPGAAPRARRARRGGVVGQREHDRGLALRRQRDERLDDADEARQALEHADAGETRPPARLAQRGDERVASGGSPARAAASSGSPPPRARRRPPDEAALERRGGAVVSSGAGMGRDGSPRVSRHGPRLGDRSGSRDNVFDVLRLAAAMAVLLSHCYPLTGREEPVARVVGETLGDLGVSVFFAISGFLVARSGAHSPGLRPFAAKRALRLLPALIVCVWLLALVLGPLLTTLSPGDYLTTPQTLIYPLRSSVLITFAGRLPGVFEHNPFIGAVDGSLWTLPLEACCYVMVAVLGVLALLHRRALLAGAVAVGPRRALAARRHRRAPARRREGHRRGRQRPRSSSTWSSCSSPARCSSRRASGSGSRGGWPAALGVVWVVSWKLVGDRRRLALRPVRDPRPGLPGAPAPERAGAAGRRLLGVTSTRSPSSRPLCWRGRGSRRWACSSSQPRSPTCSGSPHGGSSSRAPSPSSARRRRVRPRTVTSAAEA